MKVSRTRIITRGTLAPPPPPVQAVVRWPSRFCLPFVPPFSSPYTAAKIMDMNGPTIACGLAPFPPFLPFLFPPLVGMDNKTGFTRLKL